MPDSTPKVTIAAAAPKPWWQSKTLWFNGICLGLAAAEQHLPVAQKVLPGSIYAWLAFALPLGNAALRFATNTAVTLKRTPDLGLPLLPPKE